MSSRTIELTYAGVRELQAAYERAIAEKKKTFSFAGGEWDPGYAYYMLEYLADQYKDPTLKSAVRPYPPEEQP